MKWIEFFVLSVIFFARIRGKHEMQLVNSHSWIFQVT